MSKYTPKELQQISHELKLEPENLQTVIHAAEVLETIADENEPKKPVLHAKAGWVVLWDCPTCGRPLRSLCRCCSECGQPIKWED